MKVTDGVCSSQRITLIIDIFLIEIVTVYREGMLNLLSLFSLKRLPLLSLFHIVLFCPAISCPAFSCPVIWSADFTSVIFTSSIFSAPLARTFPFLLERAVKVAVPILSHSILMTSFSINAIMAGSNVTDYRRVVQKPQAYFCCWQRHLRQSQEVCDVGLL